MVSKFVFDICNIVFTTIYKDIEPCMADVRVCLKSEE